MSKARKRKRKGKSRVHRYRDAVFLTSHEPTMRLRPEVRSWPIVRAYVPVRDAWQATGFGTAGVIREQPDGRWATAFFWISLLDEGLVNLFGKDDTTAEECDTFLKSLDPLMPPTEEGPVELAAQYIWGAYALGQKKGFLWPPGLADRYFSMVPKPLGSSSQWLNRLIGSGGLTPPGLLKVIRENPVPEDIPEDQEIAIFTRMTFQLENVEAVIEQLRKRQPDFSYLGHEGDIELFDWTREYPKNHWSPLKRLGGRQILGSVRVGPDQLIAEVKALSMGARLVGNLKGMFGEQMRLKETTWRSMSDLLAGDLDED